jgi:hypothetical protein
VDLAGDGHGKAEEGASLQMRAVRGGGTGSSMIFLGMDSSLIC